MEAILWPAVVLILGIVALFIFKQPITRLLDRTERISRKGLSTTRPQEISAPSPKSQLAEFMSQTEHVMVREAEKNIRANVDRMNIKKPVDRERAIVRGFASLVVVHTFEKAYSTLYGSQLSALEYLNDNRNKQQTKSDIRAFYDWAVSNFPDVYKEYSFEQWLAYLQNLVLVQINGEDVSITVGGKEFLKYLLDQGYSKNRAG